MKLIVGLGNPEKRYKNTRHNAGFLLIDKLRISVGGEEWKEEEKFKVVISKLSREDILLVKPTTFMNSSGDAVTKLATFYKILTSNIWVIHDDLDIKLGQYKIQKGRGPELHGGVNSVEDRLGDRGFWRVRIGVDNRKEGKTISGEEYTLQDFPQGEIDILSNVFENIIRDILTNLDYK